MVDVHNDATVDDGEATATAAASDLAAAADAEHAALAAAAEHAGSEAETLLKRTLSGEVDCAAEPWRDECLLIDCEDDEDECLIGDDLVADLA